MREVCALKLMSTDQMIGGAGLHVEIDESMFVRRKSNVGRMVKEQWVFGGICRETGDCFLVAVPDRSKKTLLKIISERIKLGTTIISDYWPSYEEIPEIEGMHYTHIKVNHSENFVDPKTGACTNLVENMWGRAKKRNKLQNGTNRGIIDSYMCEFM